MAKLSSTRIYGTVVVDNDIFLGGGITIGATRKDTLWDSAYTDITSATNVNTFSTIVKRDGSGNFNASNIRATELDVIHATSTYDGITLIPRSGGTGSFIATITPGILSANRTLTLPNETGTLLTSASTLDAGKLTGTTSTPITIGGTGTGAANLIFNYSGIPPATTGSNKLEFKYFNGTGYTKYLNVDSNGQLVYDGVISATGLTASGTLSANTVTAATVNATTIANVGGGSNTWALDGSATSAFYLKDSSNTTRMTVSNAGNIAATSFTAGSGTQSWEIDTTSADFYIKQGSTPVTKLQVNANGDITGYGIWKQVRSRPDDTGLTSVGSGTTVNSIDTVVLTESHSAGDTYAIEVNGETGTASYNPKIVIITIGTSGGTVQSTQYYSAGWVTYASSTSAYLYTFNVAAVGTQMYFNYKYRQTIATSATSMAVSTLYVGRIWKIQQA